MAELQYLRAEVRSAARLAEEVATLRQEVAQLHQMKATVTDVCHELDKLRADQENFPPLHTAAGDAIGESAVGNCKYKRRTPSIPTLERPTRDQRETDVRHYPYRLKYEGNQAVLKPTTRRHYSCLLYTSPSPRDRQKSRMPSSA